MIKLPLQKKWQQDLKKVKMRNIVTLLHNVWKHHTHCDEKEGTNTHIKRKIL